jgi:hypothetical protein
MWCEAIKEEVPDGYGVDELSLLQQQVNVQSRGDG